MFANNYTPLIYSFLVKMALSPIGSNYSWVYFQVIFHNNDIFIKRQALVIGGLYRKR